MPIALVQGPIDFTSTSGSYTSNVGAGNFLVLYLGGVAFSTTAPSISDNLNGSWTKALELNDTTESLYAAIFYFANTTAGSCTVSVTNSLGANECTLYEFSGIATSSLVDTTAHNSGAGSNGDSGSLVTVNSSDLLLAGLTVGGTASGGTASWNYHTTGGNQDGVEYRIVSATGTYPTTFTSVSGFCGVSAAFKAPGTAIRPNASGTVSVTGIATARLQSWTVRQIITGNPSNTQSINIGAFPAAIISGNLIVVATLDHSGNTVNAVNDTLGTKYSKAVQAQIISANISASIWYGVATAAGTNTVTISYSGQTLNPNMRLLEIIGSTQTFPLDQFASSTGTGTSITSGTTPALNNINEFLFGYLWATSGMTSGETNWIQAIEATSGTLTEYFTPQVGGTYAATGTATGNASGNYLGILATFLPGAGGPGAFHPGLTSGTALVTGVANAHTTGFVRPGPISGKSGVTAVVLPKVPIRAGPITGLSTISGVVHGTIGLPNLITASTGTTLNTRLIFRPMSLGTITPTGVTTVRNSGTLRLMITGTSGVTGVLIARTNPFRPVAAGTILVTGVTNPRQGFLHETAAGTPGVTGVISPKLIFRSLYGGPIMTGAKAVTGITARTVIRTGPITGSTIGSAVLNTLPLIFYPRAGGKFNTAGVLSAKFTGVFLRPFSIGNIATVAALALKLNPIELQWTGIVLTSGMSIPRITGAFKYPVITVSSPGFYVVTTQWGTYLVWQMAPGINYWANGVQIVLFGPFSNYNSAQQRLIQFADNDWS